MKKIFLIFYFFGHSLILVPNAQASPLQDYRGCTPSCNSEFSCVFQDVQNLGNWYECTPDNWQTFIVSSCECKRTSTTNIIGIEKKEKESSGVYFTPNVSMPGFASIGQPVKISPDSIALYINAVYKYGAGFAGLVAIFMIVFAAWQWIMAAGNSGKIDNAKDTIIASLVGLTLLFGGYLLLSQISSRLVNLKSLEIDPIPTRLFYDGTCKSEKTKQDCDSKSDCVWNNTNKSCEMKSVCDANIDLAYSNKSNGRLLCCDGKFALKGESSQNCSLICGLGYEDEEGNNLEICQENYCGLMDNQETSCKRFPGFCEWDEDDNTCDEYGGQRGNDGDDCDDPTDCLPGFCCDVDYLSANDCRAIGDPEADNCMPAIEPITNCASISSCESYTNSTHCLANACRNNIGDCRWDDDWPQGCKAINAGYCGGNGECLTTGEENNNSSQYCCCETYTPDHCDLRSSCAANCQSSY